MSTIDTTWETDVTGPFKDNTSGAIHPATMRSFANAIRTQQVSVASAGMTFQGAYSGATTYHLNDVVTLAGASYICIVASSVGASPPGGNWALLAGSGSVVYGVTAGTAAEGNDARLSDQRTPLDASVTDAKIATTLSPAKITGTAVVNADARLTNQRVPTDASVTDAKISGTLSASKITGTAVTGTVTNAKMAQMPANTLKGNLTFSSALPTDYSATDISAFLSGVLQASQVAVDSAGGAVGPTVQTAIQDVVTKVNTVPRFN